MMDIIAEPQPIRSTDAVSHADEESVPTANAQNKRSIKRSRRIIYGLLTTAFVLAVIEGMSWIMIAMIPHSAPRRTADIYAEQSDQIRRFLDTTAAKHRGVHPVLGWCSNPNYRSAMYCTNSKALRGVREYTPVPSSGTLRVAAFGSSIVECSEVDDANAWPALIEAANPDIEVLNYGVGGYGTDQAYLRYLAEGSDFAPHVVLIGFTSDELGRTVNVYRRFISTVGQGPLFKPRYTLEADGKLSLLETPLKSRSDYERVLNNPSAITDIGKRDYWYQPSVYENPLYDWSAAVRLASWMSTQIYRRCLAEDRLVIGDEFNDSSAAFRIQMELFSEFAEAVRASGALPIVVLLPEKESVQRGLAGGAKLYDPLLTPLQERGIDYLDAVDAFRDVDPAAVNSWYAPGGHYSPAGNRIIADWLPGKIKLLVEVHESNSRH